MMPSAAPDLGQTGDIDSGSAKPVVLIVDDHVDIRRLLSVSFAREYQVIEAENGIMALDAVRRYHPRLVLLDIMMPGEIDGLWVLDAIKGNPVTSDILVAIVSARGQLADHQAARMRGADAYFVKPFSPLQLVDWVHDKLSS
jgi:CheY-like chemotaxis protein